MILLPFLGLGQTNDPPVAMPDIFVISDLETVLVFDVLANDFDPEGQTLTITGNGTPQYGSVIFDGSDSFTYMPSGTLFTFDVFEYTVCDNGNPLQCALGLVIIEFDDPSPIFDCDSCDPNFYDPVCADGFDFINSCFAVCQGFTEFESGACFSNPVGGCNCPANYDPVCADGVIFANACMALCSGVDDFVPGECIPSGDPGGCLCIEIYDPVCASGISFPNACFAQCAGFMTFEFGECSNGDLPPIDSCESDCVWPGDINLDGIVNHFDLLSLGMAQGAVGSARFEASFLWEPQYSIDWPLILPDGTNYKHADCDGNGIIDEFDFLIVLINYGLTHDSDIELDPIAGWFEINLQIPQGPFNGGESVQIPLELGSPVFPIEDFYGLAFTLEYNPDFVEPGTFTLSLDNSWIGDPDELQFVVMEHPNQGILEVGITRTDNQPVNGFGMVGTLSLILEENLAGIIAPSPDKDMDIGLRASRNPFGLHKLVEVQEQNLVLEFNDPVTGITPSPYEGKIFLMPNPVADELTLLIEESCINCSIKMVNSLGQKVINLPLSTSQGVSKFDVRHLQAGVYFIEMLDENGRRVYTDKVLVQD
ncbi:MAG: Ig-like domain-containing protein [Bacteroidota bacterium]